jgi:peptidoglycan/xylan/chitin deacetylase (PgdA/CDA1 family)
MKLPRRLDAGLLTRPPRLLHALLPACQWTGPPVQGNAPVLYLTFDDGPIPEETPWVLEQLGEYGARATFFCVGQNLERYPDIARAALAAGHRLGNHTHQHRSAWAVGRAEYLAEVTRCQDVLNYLHAKNQAPSLPVATLHSAKPLFRPPYGRLTWPLLQALRPHHRVVMWSVLTRDYDPDLSPERCLELTLAATRPGDILVFHDSQKAAPRLRFALPRVLAHFAEQGYQFAAL